MRCSRIFTTSALPRQHAQPSIVLLSYFIAHLSSTRRVLASRGINRRVIFVSRFILHVHQFRLRVECLPHLLEIPSLNERRNRLMVPFFI